MCIAIYKDAKAAPIKRKILQTCFNNNQDGAGYAWWDKKKKLWIARKGFMSFNDFWKSFNAHGFQKKDSYICHFRIGTSGNKRGPDCTHPFPVVSDCEVMRETEFETKNLVVHNGVHGRGDGTISDTMLAVRDWVYPLFPLMDDEERGERIMEIMCEGLKMNSNRWLVTEGYEVTLIGNWTTDEETGIRYSNEGWKAPKTVYTNPQRHRTGQTQTNGPNTTNGSESVPTGDGIVRCWSGDHATKYLDDKGNFKWLEWAEDYRHHMDNMQLITSELAEKIAPNEQETDTKMVSPSLTCAYKDEPVSVMGTVDHNGDCVWEGAYDPAEDLLMCPHCKEDKYLVDPNDHYKNANATAKLADTLCQRCGCLFMDENGVIAGYDFEIRKEYQTDVSSG
jgi:hypothetical protein